VTISLPLTGTNDPKYQERQSALTKKMRKLYNYQWFKGLIPRSGGGPIQGLDTPGTDYIRLTLATLYRIRLNVDKIMAEKRYIFKRPAESLNPQQIATLLRTVKTGKLTGIYAWDPKQVTNQNGGRAQRLDEYEKIFREVGLPEFVSNGSWLSDREFSRSFVAGAHPDRLRKLTDLPEGLSDEHLKKADFEQKSHAFQADSLNQALADSRLFVVDYSFMGKYDAGRHDNGETKHVYAATAYFAVPHENISSERSLSVFAIRIAAESQDKVYTPSDGWAWQIAKGMLNASHYTFHETCSHLGFTHLVLEPIITSMRRHLPQEHPVYHLLNPHFEGTRAINHSAFTSLIVPDAAVDRLIGCDLTGAGGKLGAYQLIKEQREQYNFKDNYFPNKIALVRSADNMNIPEYPYFDDGILVWNALHEWVDSYIRSFYDSDLAVANDPELAQWAKEISNQTPNQGGGLHGFGSEPENAQQSRIRSLKELVDICTKTIFVAGPEHAAVNFTQKSDMIYLPAANLSGYLSAQTLLAKEASEITEQDYLKFLPPIDVAIVQCSMLELLGSVRYTVLGQYNKGYFTSALSQLDTVRKSVDAALRRLQGKLAEIEGQINTRNQSGARKSHPYEVLRPTMIPQSINI
jgi:arachidonate 15-lipoxygenase